MPDPWVVPKLWPGETCFILGGGPSLEAVNIDQLQGRRVIAVNLAFMLAPWIDVMFFGDRVFGQQFRRELLHGSFGGLRITVAHQYADEPGFHWVRKDARKYGICPRRDSLRWNLSSGACAIGLAAHFGVGRIVLLGYDMRLINDRNNYHTAYDRFRAPERNPYAHFLKPFPDIARDLHELGIECVNATPGSALQEFKIVEPEEALCYA